MAAETLKIVRFHTIGPPEVLQFDELPLPEPAKGEIVPCRAKHLNALFSSQSGISKSEPCSIYKRARDKTLTAEISGRKSLRGNTLTPYLKSELVITLGVSDHHLLPPHSRGEASQISSQLAAFTTPRASAGSLGEPGLKSVVSLSPAPEQKRATNEQSIRRLRLDLVEMLRISLHTVDYATKAYALGLVEFALSAQRGRTRLGYLNQAVIATTQELHDAGKLDHLQSGFSEFARAISASLFSTCQHAYKVSSHTVALLRGGMHQNSKESVQLGERIHRLLRLCAVAIMKRKIEYVDAVLREIDTWRYGSTKKPWRPEYAAQAMLASDVHECSIAASLKQMMENLSTIAAASITTIPLSV